MRPVTEKRSYTFLDDIGCGAKQTSTRASTVGQQDTRTIGHWFLRPIKGPGNPSCTSRPQPCIRPQCATEPGLGTMGHRGRPRRLPGRRCCDPIYKLQGVAEPGMVICETSHLIRGQLEPPVPLSALSPPVLPPEPNLDDTACQRDEHDASQSHSKACREARLLTSCAQSSCGYQHLLDSLHPPFYMGRAGLVSTYQKTRC